MRLTPQQIQSLLVQAEDHYRNHRLAQAEAACREVLATAPNNPLATHYLGAIAFSANQVEPALQLLARATELDPNVAAYFWVYGSVLGRTGRLDDALVALRSAARLDPDNAEYVHTAGALAGMLGHVDVSIELLTRALQLDPNLRGAYNDLGISLTAARRLPDAIKQFRFAIEKFSDYKRAYDNLIYFSHFANDIDPLALRKMAESWAERFAEPLRSQIAPHSNDRSPDRRLKIGFISPDLWSHPVGRFLVPILRAHDRDNFEIRIYNDSEKHDTVTQALHASADQWREVQSLADDALAHQIRFDCIDILVDLSLHMGGNRLMVFARRPAPVQVTYLGYAGTSGMTAMHWRLSDQHLDPLDNDKFYTERTWRLPRSYWCYSAPVFSEPIERKPRDPNRPIAFACLNNTCKMSDPALDAWARILSAVPNSTILIQGEPGQHLDVMRSFFTRANVNPDRVSFAPKQKLMDYFKLYETIDVALDSFPYAGGTTTCDALWMGIPVITLAGQTAVQRGSVSILTNLGLVQFVANTIDDYVAAAIALANNPRELTQLHDNLRSLMESSFLMDPKAFTADLEQGFRAIWKNYVSAAE